MRLSSQTVAGPRSTLGYVNRWNVQIVLETLNNDVVTWTLSDRGLESLRADIKAGELGRVHIMHVDPVETVGLVALAA